MHELPARRRLVAPGSCLHTIRRPLTGSWPGGNVPPQPGQHVLDGVPYPLVMRVSRGLECGSHAAAPAMLTIRCVVGRYPS